MNHLRSYYKAIRYSARVCNILLSEQRYFASVRNGEYLDAQGNYVPWFTFPAIEALKNWDLSGKRVFEYGSGYSTLFWACRAKEIVSVEHDPAWYEKITKLLPMNAHILLAPITQQQDEYQPTLKTREQFERYAEAIKDFGTFDVICLDGYAKSRVRYKCAQAAISQLAENGLVILDNSDWLPGTALFLRTSGLIEVDLSGLVPGNNICQTTSLFFTRQFDFQPAGNRQPLPAVGGRVANWERGLERELQAKQLDTNAPR
jgi:hypothetical protein